MMRCIHWKLNILSVIQCKAQGYDYYEIKVFSDDDIKVESDQNVGFDFPMKEAKENNEKTHQELKLLNEITEMETKFLRLK